MTPREIAATLTILLGCVIFAHGQDAALQIRAVLHDPSKPDAKFFVGKPGAIMVPLKLAEEGLTESQQVTTDHGNLNLFLSATADPQHPEAGLAATVKIPPGTSRLIVIILPAPKGSPPYQLVVLKDDAHSFPWGEGKAVNLTAVDFALEVGKQKVLLSGGKITAVPKVTHVNEYNRAQTNFYYKQGDQWVVAAERQMQYVGTLRRVFLIFKTPNALAPDVRTLVDHLPQVKPKAAAQ